MPVGDYTTISSQLKWEAGYWLSAQEPAADYVMSPYQPAPDRPVHGKGSVEGYLTSSSVVLGLDHVATDGAFHPNAADQRGGYDQALESSR
ncbi:MULTISPECIES: hypothetical protein [Streptomyces]|uniref:hypothetical protein n=1 Tax=Streptomyces TaxID=1883 RepID=UPI00131A2162|nr:MULTISPECIES: hypothetical protein [Streptomyces]QKV67331.1 hypothetical protein HUT13_00005 [Streptomyces harbinensis]